MGDSSKKRKERSGDDRDKKGPKRSKGGSGGKWQTPHQVAKTASRGSGKVEAGDVGIWATCARTMEGRATTELKSMFEECAERFYGIVPPSESKAGDGADEEDIEASIQKELAAMTDKELPKLFSPVWLDMDCVMFFKTQSPIDPVDFVHRICQDIVSNPDVRKMRYVNRLSPNTMITTATETGLLKLGKTVLADHFKLSGEARENDKEIEHGLAYSYAIRPTIRAHKVMARDLVINQIASMVDDIHKVNLTKPDKVIIVDIFQGVCGMSVVDGDWETLKRFNLAELYKPTPTIDPSSKPEAIAEAAKTTPSIDTGDSKTESKIETAKIDKTQPAVTDNPINGPGPCSEEVKESI